jgi:archaellum biogenesis protein FlaJ (TadC family)
MTIPYIGNVEQLLQFLAGLSLVTFLLSIICIPLLVARLPQDYFQLAATEKEKKNQQLSLRYLCIFLFRNIIGFLLLFAGIAMLFLPGQGIITIIIGLAIMSFPYKHVLIYRLTRPMAVQRSLDWIRIRSKKNTFYW